MSVLTVGSLFSGIGGLELGLEWTGGFKTVWQVECDPKQTGASRVRHLDWFRGIEKSWRKRAHAAEARDAECADAAAIMRDMIDCGYTIANSMRSVKWLKDYNARLGEKGADNA